MCCTSPIPDRTILTDSQKKPSMNETVIHVDTEQGKIISIDVKDDNSFVAYTDNKEVITGAKRLLIDSDIKFPIIRFLEKGKFILADTRTSNVNPNVYIFDFDGNLLKSFLAGDGIEDILIHNNKIVVTYFDEGVFGQDGPNNNGLSTFSFDGKLQFGFNGNKEGLHIYDCYCVCKTGSNKILFYAYDLFNVVELNLDDFSWKELKTPHDFKGASAMSSIGNKIIFHSSYHDKLSFFEWNIQEGVVAIVGEYSSQLKGLEKGKFLAVGERGFTIIDTLN